MKSQSKFPKKAIFFFSVNNKKNKYKDGRKSLKETRTLFNFQKEFINIMDRYYFCEESELNKQNLELKISIYNYLENTLKAIKPNNEEEEVVNFSNNI